MAGDRDVWYDDLASCLQVDIALVLAAHGWDPVRALGTGWRFRAVDGRCEPVEYFHPAGDELGDWFALYHPVRLRWHHPADEDSAHEQVVAALARGVRPIVAVDNYHLPFRPAYHDVHAAHLVVVEGWDPGPGDYTIHDPMPPAFRGRLDRATLARSRASANPDDGSDPFFAGSSPGLRWLEVEPAGEQPALDWPWLRDALDANVRAMDRPGAGLPAARTLLRELPERVERHGPAALREVYVIGWPAQAEASLHARLLARAADRLDRPDLAEAARWVDLVAAGWTGVRIAAAHGADDPGRALDLIARHGRVLTERWDHALHRVAAATGTRRENA